MQDALVSFQNIRAFAISKIFLHNDDNRGTYRRVETIGNND